MRTRLNQEFDMTTRNMHTRVNCEMSFSVDGRELPPMSVLGSAVDDAIKLIQERVTESYKVVPPRIAAPTPETAGATNV